MKLHRSYCIPGLAQSHVRAVSNEPLPSRQYLQMSKCDQASDLKQLELADELESDPQDTVYWDRTWLFNVHTGKTQLVSFARPNYSGAFDVKMDGSVPEERSLSKMLGLLFSFKLDWSSCIAPLLRLPPGELEPWFILWSFFHSKLLSAINSCCLSWALSVILEIQPG